MVFKLVDGLNYDLIMKGEVDVLYRDILKVVGELCEVEVRCFDYCGLVLINKIWKSCIVDVMDMVVCKFCEVYFIVFYKSLNSDECYDVVRMSLGEM